MRGPGRNTVGITILVVAVLAAAALTYSYSRRNSAISTASSTSSPPVNSAVSSATASISAESSAAQTYSYRVVNAYPHDPGAFTEGLTYYNGSLYESTGLYGASSLRRVDLETGKVLQQYGLPSRYFGEGIAIYDGRIVQLTYQEHIGFVYDLKSFSLLGNFSYPDEGWGLTYNGSQLIMSDGTSNLYFLNPQTFQRSGEVTVHDGSTLIKNLNELEYINGSVFANVWLTNRIAIINPSTGVVTAWIDLTGIENLPNGNPNAVLNGIAYDTANHRLFVTGKLWPHLFEIRLVEPSGALEVTLGASANETPSTGGRALSCFESISGFDSVASCLLGESSVRTAVCASESRFVLAQESQPPNQCRPLNS